MIGELGTAIQEVLSAFGVEVAYLQTRVTDSHRVEGFLCIITGLLERDGERKGIMSLELDQEGASFLAGIMIGDPEGFSSEMGLSALSELATMVCGAFLARLDVPLLATPPTGVVGEDLQGILSVMPAWKVQLRLGRGSLVAGLSLS
ncbi:MAG: chemotaxis protein CheX [Candidatus Caldatribacterium sp.]|nr:chemotaxis protein CheX [Candidatus Caldatribacterium sp.]